MRQAKHLPIIRIGIDEVGRGALAGPVTACAYLGRGHPAIGMDQPPLRDSKALSRAGRRRIAADLPDGCRWRIASVSAAGIDRINIKNASLQAMRLACCALLDALSGEIGRCRQCVIIIDGTTVPAGLAAGASRRLNRTPVELQALIKADTACPEVAMASILAKVWRDQWMQQAAGAYPGYGFGSNAGYATDRHRRALEQFGACRLHRRSFRPVAGAADSTRV